MASSTITGVGSGFDTIGIVKALVDAEKAPKQSQITAQQKDTTIQLSAVGTVKASLETYRAAIAKLNSVSSFNGLTASSNDEKISKVTIDDKASSGKYALNVTQLATASKITSKVFEGGASASVNSSEQDQTLTISQSGDSYDVKIPAGATMQQTRDAINTQLQSKGISANVLTDANGSRLVIGSQTTGKGTDITVSGDSELATGYDAGKPPMNAEYTIDDIAMESSSNKITSAISGVTLELLDTKASTITVASNTDTLKTSVQSFVTAYNALLTSINTQTKVTATGDAATTTAGALTGDASMRQLVNGLRGELLQNSGTSSVGNLSQMGISTDQKTGLLTLDDTKWKAAVATPNGAIEIAKVFTGDTGLITRMTKATESYVGSSGLLAARATDLNTKLTTLTTQQADLDRRMESMKSTLTAKYTAMDGLIAKINASSSSIMTTLNSLNNPKSD
ncbi:flagellar filament capping protein FliD [Pseudomonas psychrophila]|jgi:flagellar hook-associated protein 2|uniref:Flagellar hook-associated protein 2 n=1 Tax=Pseudomonas psychrophila TaxID=122355 RepID=A0ABY0W2H3_9PSED|nr:flagellar filament capping protein FliD [Pseudomonas psychrophila]KAB0491405.1 flagellar filament capping protein FliD [Pseudomonas psychrophila]KMN00520.1 flagellar cap protein FliD [Pseudomonas psychrophila]QIE34227.1 flagellar filament capping protein FliD [Pseudomonas psychrophila]WVI96324.1 flagellar filament capping protein FliD [Pseudomonas psychrophila]SDU70224.1 flagellar hook-associated protein 2 [Pseudomonas psychrophila]